MIEAAVDDFAAIEPAPTRVTFKGREVEILPLDVGQLPGFARAIRPIMGKLDDFDVSLGGFVDLMADHGEDIITAVCIATSIKRTEIERCSPVDLLGLVMPVLKVNADFFGRRLRQLAPVMAAALSALPGAGLTP